MKRFTGPGFVIASAVVVVVGAAGLAFVGIFTVFGMRTDHSAPMTVREIIQPALLVRTLITVGVIGALATLLAIPAGWVMRSAPTRTGAMLLAPLLLPMYLVYASWGLLRAPGTMLGDWLARAGPDAFRVANTVQAVGGLALWSWPIAAILLGGACRRITQDQLDAARAAAGSRRRFALFMANALRRPIMLAVVVVSLLMTGSAVPLHVARIPTTTIDVWRRLNETSDVSHAWLAATPMLFIALLAGVVISHRLASVRTAESPVDRLDAYAPRRGAMFILALMIWLGAALVPAALFLWSLREMRSLWRQAEALAPALRESAIVGLGAAILGFIIAAGALAGFAHGRGRAGRGAAHVMLTILLLGAMTPGVLIGSALLAASRYAPLDWIVETRFGLVVAHTLRFGALGAIAGWWIARLEPTSAADLRRLDAAGSFGAWWMCVGAGQSAALLASSLAIFLLSLHEIEATVMLAPPGPASLAQALLNELHYLRQEELSAAGVWLSLGGLLIALVVSMLIRSAVSTLRRRAGSIISPVLFCTTALFMTGCEGRRRGADSPPGSALVHARSFGELGASPGQFVYPRGLDADEESLWIIDKTARVQRWSFDGEPVTSWNMPAFEKGKPTGITIGPDGRVYVADTHEHRIAVFTKTGELVDQWGRYGMGPGEFVYPTDVAFLLDEHGAIERIYVSEYGGNDRISVFSPSHDFLFSFGKEGSSAAPGRVEFSRPQSIVVDSRQRGLIVADAANHRLGRFTTDGALISWIGAEGAAPGDRPGEFRYPYGLAMLPDQTILVSEFGGNRVQRIDPAAGVSLGVYGRGGTGDGDLRTPWGVAVAHPDRPATMSDDAESVTIFVLNSGVNQVISFRLGDQLKQESAWVGSGALRLEAEGKRVGWKDRPDKVHPGDGRQGRLPRWGRGVREHHGTESRATGDRQEGAR